ncbi:hypothetical protein F7725_027762, partial [Dissostichus mawsoni]
MSSLKTTVEGLVSTNNPNVWSRYGGLQRLHKDMNNILSHGLKNEQVYYKQRDYWPFVWCVRYISPHLASHVEQFGHLEPVLSSGMRNAGESYKAERWLLHSLQVHMLSAQLRPLLRHMGHTSKYYNGESCLLLSEPHVTAMFQCLEAVEQKTPNCCPSRHLWAVPSEGPNLSGPIEEPEPVCIAWSWCSLEKRRLGSQRRISKSQTHHFQLLAPRSSRYQPQLWEHYGNPTSSSTGAPWLCVSRPGDSERGVTPPLGPGSIPGTSLTESPSPASFQPDAGDSCDCDYDDGPEYLAIGNLGQRSRCESQSSTHSSEVDFTPDLSMQRGPLAPPPPRRSSFSEGQRGPGRGSRGHTRSLSDTGINQKLRNGGGHRKITIIIEDPVAESAGQDCCIKNYSPFSPQRKDVSTPSSLYMESHGSQCSIVSDGMFRKPSEGQSLISYLSEQDFGSCADLEKENAHFSISESLIAAIELMKYNLRRQQEAGEEEGDSDNEIQQLKQKIRLRRQQIRRSRLPPCANSQQLFHSTDSGGSRRSSQDSYQGLSDSGSAEEVEECELQDGCEGQSLLAMSQNGLSLSLASLFSDADIKRSMSSSNRSFLSSESISPAFLQSNSAESVAMGLLRQFEGMQLPAASELDWLVPEHDAPQKLRIRVRGNLEWAPPRPQIIFNIHPAPKRKIVVAKQNYRCAGCGTRIDPDYIKRLRYCEYLGRYFCQCCHENAQAVVPGRVLRKWDFSKYYVSNFARDLLSKIAGDPLFNPNDINSGLYKKNKALEVVRVLRVQLFHMKNLFKTCRFAKEVLDQFDSLPGHLTEDLHLFSLNDLSALCQAKGFVCEFCGNEKDIIFPFQLNKCQRCEGEPSLLAAGQGGPKAPFPRPFVSLPWSDWNISKHRRLMRALFKDRREGEGGEPGLERGVDQGVKGGGQEERGGTAGERQERGGIFQVFTPGMFAKAFTRSKGNEEEQEVKADTASEGEKEVKCDEGNGKDGDDCSQERRSGREGEMQERKELKKNIAKADRRDSDSETCSSRESLNEVDQDVKARWSVTGLASLVKGFSKREIEDEGKTEVKEEASEEEFSEKETESVEEGKTSSTGEEDYDISDKGQTEAAKRENSGAETVEKFSLMKLLQPNQLSAVFSKGRNKGKVDRSEVKRESDTEKVQPEPHVITRSNWRGRKTRKAMRESRGRKSAMRAIIETASGQVKTVLDVSGWQSGGRGWHVKTWRNKKMREVGLS